MGHPRRCCCFFFRFLPAKTTATTTTRCPMPSCSSGRSGTQQPIISSIDSSSSAIVVINISIIKSQKSFYFLLKKLWKYSYRWRIFFRENPQVSNLFNVDNSVNKINNISQKDNFGKPTYYYKVLPLFDVVLHAATSVLHTQPKASSSSMVTLVTMATSSYLILDGHTWSSSLFVIMIRESIRNFRLE